jgi:L-arabinonolactonase
MKRNSFKESNFNVVRETALILDCRLCLAEGIVWDDREHLLYWVNIHDAEVWRWNPDSDTSPAVFHLPERVCALGLRESGGLVLALASGFALFDPANSMLENLANVERDLPTTRLNDGRVDAAGRFVCGGMDESSAQLPLSSLYSVGTDRKVGKLLAGVTCTNSLCWSPDGGQLYFTDMPTKRIDAFDYDLRTGRVSNRRTFASLADEPGLPDGSAIDAEGFLWNAQWRGSKVVRYRPDGLVDSEFSLPVSNPTCVAFGGPDLDVLYVTSAWFDLTQEERALQPHAGSLFALKPGVRGRPEFRYLG